MRQGRTPRDRTRPERSPPGRAAVHATALPGRVVDDAGGRADALVAEVLHDIRLARSFYYHGEVTAPWGLTFPAPAAGPASAPATDRAAGPLAGRFHFVAAGRAALRMSAASEEVLLGAGDLALFPFGVAHRVCSPGALAGACRPVDVVPHQVLSPQAAHFTMAGGGAPATLICGAVEFTFGPGHPLLAAVPRLIVVSTTDGGAAALPPDAALRGTLDLLTQEVRQRRVGGTTVMTRLADVLVVQVLRAWIEAEVAREHGPAAGWLGALRDPAVARAMTALHRAPGAAWTVARLAREAHLSRGAFAARFATLVGVPPLEYLTGWRMQIATRRLRDEGASVAAVAEQLGYGSTAAFSRAYKRVTGRSPGRRRAAPGTTRQRTS